MFERLFSIRPPTMRGLLRKRAKTAGYRSEIAHSASALFNYDERPPFSLMTAELMSFDPKVTIALAARNGLLMNAEVDITDGRPEVMDWVRAQWDAIWGRDADKLLRTKVFGYGGFEVMYRKGVGRWSGKIVYDSIRDFHPRDVRPLTKGGKVVGVSVNNVRGTSDQSPVTTTAGHKIPLWRPKSLWLTFGGRFGSLFGESLLEHAYAPWHEKTTKGGAIKLRQLRMAKDAWMGHVIRYPNEKTVDWKTGEDVTWKDIARDITENAMSGSAFGLPSGTDANGNLKWDLTPPTSVEGATQIFEYAHECDREILEGCQVPAEVLEAMSSGGFSGRSIPFISLLAILQFEFNRYVQAIDDQILREGVRLNFGVEPQYEIKPKSLIETIGKVMGGGGDQGSDESSPDQGGDPSQSAGFNMPGQVRAQGGIGGGGADKPTELSQRAVTRSQKRATGAIRDQQGQPTKAPAGGALVGGIFYEQGSWIPPRAIQFADSEEIERLDAAAQLVDSLHAAAEPEEIDMDDRPATLSLPDREPMQLADSARAPVGGVTIGGTFYKGGEFIPGDVVEGATKEEKAAIEGGEAGAIAGGGGEKGKGPDAPVIYNAKTKKWTMENGEPIPSHLPRIPPAWRDVVVSTNPDSDLLVKGRDAKGRNQMVYSDSFASRQSAKKFLRVNEFREKSDAIRNEILSDTQSSDPMKAEDASAAMLIFTTGLRPGSRADTGAEKQAFGATTLEGRHVTVGQDGGVILKFTGKKGVSLEIPVRDETTAAMLKDRKRGDNEPLFNTSDARLRKYVKSKDGGGFKPKDMRTAKGTNTAIEAMRDTTPPKSPKEYKSKVMEVARSVAKVLGNTPVIALQSYVDPNIFSMWRIEGA